MVDGGDLGSVSIDVTALVPRALAHAARVVPLRLEARVLVCLAELPLDPGHLQRVQAAACREVRLVGGSAEEVEAALLHTYGPARYEEVDDLVQAVSKAPRRKTAHEIEDHPRRNAGPMKVIAVTSGKGGVGKSSTTANLALSLARNGYRVGVVDCDFGLSNLHLMFGVTPQHTLSDVIAGRVGLLGAFEAVRSGLYLLAGPNGASDFVNLTYGALQAAGAGFSQLEPHFDFLFLDTAAGIQEGVLSLLLSADETVVVTTPDPAAVLDAYVTTRALLDRRPSATVRCIVNQTPDEGEAKLIFAKFMTFLGLSSSGRAHYLGSVHADRAVQEANRSRTPVLEASPHSRAAREFDSLACRLGNVPVDPDRQVGFLGRLLGQRAA